ncbi:MAG: division/cell wall cluster transcriptional repressor MraZ [Porticoccaceae bacterium]
MFRGSNEINIDAKGRMAVPVRYRDGLLALCEGVLVATIDIQDKCLLIYPMPKWQEIETKIASLSTFNKESRRVQRLLVGHAREIELDSNGRVLIPPELRAYAGLEKKVILVGQSHRFELWSADSWDTNREEWLEQAAGEVVIPEEMQSLSL